MLLARMKTAILLVIGTSFAMSPVRALSELGSKASRDDHPETKKRHANSPGRLLVLRIGASQKHDAEAILKAQAPEGLKHPPEGYEWVRFDSKLRNREGLVLRKSEGEAPDGLEFLLVKLDTNDVTERDLLAVEEAKGDHGEPAINFRLNPPGAKKLGTLTRTHIPEEEGAFKHRLAMIVDGVAIYVPALVMEISSGQVLLELGRDADQSEVARIFAGLSAAVQKGQK
ncbi:hypothetical protein P12x_004918 [Tundrisphaera lichenicola]|uniref:hypothetical protein n=1 Tax=Tundrisphaera lichenicola TaxID=2029860 RepID=UPI003EC1007D